MVVELKPDLKPSTVDFWQYEREVTIEEVREYHSGLANEREW